MSETDVMTRSILKLIIIKSIYIAYNVKIETLLLNILNISLMIIVSAHFDFQKCNEKENNTIERTLPMTITADISSILFSY